MVSRAVRATALLLVAAWHGPQASAQSPAVRRAEVEDRLAALDRAGRAMAAARCPRPVEVLTRFLNDPLRPAERDEMSTFDCRELRVTLLKAAGSTQEQPVSVVVQGHHPLLLAPLEVGAATLAVLAALGEPERRFGPHLSYRLHPQRERDRVTFEIESGVVRAISFAWAPE